MRCYLTLLLLVGAAVAFPGNGWTPGQEYHYLVRSRTLTGLEKLRDQFAGVWMKCELIIQAKSSNKLSGKILHSQYARVHRILLDGKDSDISDQMLGLRELPLSGKSFEIQLKNGLIQNLIVGPDVPNWELNLLKSIVSQLQIDTQGKSAKKSKSTQVPDGQSSYGMFKAIEESVGGKCEVLYDITPLSEDVRRDNPELAPLADLDGGNFINIIKTKDYNQCKQQKFYCLTTDNQDILRSKRNNDDSPSISRSSTSHVVLSGSSKKFTIQYSETTDNILVKPRKSGSYLGVVYSKIKLTLVKREKISEQIPEMSGDVILAENLMYTFYGLKKINYPSLPSDESSENSKSDSEENSNDSNLTNSGSSEEYIPTLDLERAPNHPLVSYSEFYSNVDSYEDIDLVESSQSLILELAKDLKQSNNLSENKGLEKFPFLVELLRSMNKNQYVELEKRLHNEYDGEVDKEIKDILRDAVTHAGSGPALLTITEWIMSKKLEGTQAARVISKIPKVAIMSSPEYVKAFFELITHPVVKKQRILNTIAPTAFAAIIRKSLSTSCTFLEGSRSHDSGNWYSANEKALNETYIPYMASQLKEAVVTGDSTLIQTYIFTLGYFANPRVLEVFKPYLEGSQPISKFNRMWIVTSLASLTTTCPELLGPIFFKIYLNAQEAPEIRSAAILNYIMTNPSLSSLLRMALYTKYERSERVRSTVLDVLEDLTSTKHPDLKDLAIKSRITRKLMNLKGSSGKKTIDYYSLHYNGQGLQDVSNDGSGVPNIAYLYADNYYNLLGLPTELQYTLLNIMQLWPNMNMNMNQEKQNLKDSRVEKIARAINTKFYKEEGEGNVFINTLYAVQFHSFTDKSIKDFVELVQKSLQKDLSSNWLDMHEEAITFPTESGLLFWQSLTSLQVLRINQENSHHEGSPWKSSTVKWSGKFEAISGSRVQGKFGFKTMNEHQNYIASISNDVYVRIPTSYQLEKSGKSWNWKLNPMHQIGNQKMKALHYAIVPSTSICDLFNIRPLSDKKDTHLVLRSKEVSKSSYDKGSLHIEQEGDNKERSTKEVDMKDLLKNSFESSNENNALYYKLDVYVDTPEKGHEICLNVVFDKLETNRLPSGRWSRGGSAKHFDSLTVLSEIDRKPNSEARRKKFLEKVSSSLKSVNAYVWDIDVDISLLSKQYQRQVLTIGVGNSNVEGKSQSLLYWNSQSPDGKIDTEACAIGKLQNSKIPIDLDLNENGFKLRNEFTLDAQIRKKSYTKGNGIHFVGNISQSKDWTEKVSNSEIKKQCQQNKKLGKQGTQACRKTAELLEMKDSMNLTMEFESEDHNTLANTVVQYVSEIIPDTRINTVSPRNLGTRVIDMQMKLLPDLEKVDVSMYTSTLDLNFPSCKICKTLMSPSLFTLSGLLGESEKEGSCIIGRQAVSTFDKKSYPLTLGKCQHVVMITYPQVDPKNPDKYLPIPEEMDVAILAMDLDGGTRNIEMIMGDNVIQMYQEGDDIHVRVNEETIELSQDASYRIKSGDETIIEIIDLPGRFIKLVSKKYEVESIFDGTSLQLRVSNKYRNAVEGLCGNFDNEYSNDFTSPQNCIVTKPEEFSAVYALTESNCEGPALENKLRFEESECVVRSYRQSNVISDKEAGRSSSQDKSYIIPRTRVIEVEHQFCFTIKPLPMCVQGTKPKEAKMKKIPLHCLPMNEESYKLKRRVEKGANPDLSRKSVSRMHVLELPVACALE